MVIKQLLKSVREYKRASILTPVLVAIEVVLECLLPFVMAEMIDYINPPQVPATRLFYFLPQLAETPMQIKGVLCYAAILVAMAVMSLVCGMMSGWFCAHASEGMVLKVEQCRNGAIL